MNKKDLIENCIGSHRLESEPKEVKTMEWLLSNSISSNETNLDSIKNLILCMDRYGFHYKFLFHQDKILVDELLKNPKIVDIVLTTMFRWFGSQVGQFSIKQMSGETNRKK